MKVEVGVIEDEELDEAVKEQLCSEGICFKPEDKLEIIAIGWDDYVEYAREFLEDACGDCYRAGLTVEPEWLAESMLGDTVYEAEIDGQKIYVRLA